MPPVESSLVIGGASAIARALHRHGLPQAQYVARNSDGMRPTIRVADYSLLTAESMCGHTSVINCVGVTQGDSHLMQRINVELAEALAIRAKEAGVSRFIHISSFSVYGRCEVIDHDSAAQPDTLYGASKLEADQRLLALASESFRPILLRLPLIYDPAQPSDPDQAGDLGKLGQLLSLWRRTGFFPAPASDVARSMIGTDLVAQLILELIGSNRSGVTLAADPVPFSYALARRACSEPLRVVPLPRWIVAVAQQLAPNLSLRLFSDSLLAQEANLAIELGLPSRLEHDIAQAQI